MVKKNPLSNTWVMIAVDCIYRRIIFFRRSGPENSFAINSPLLVPIVENEIFAKVNIPIIHYTNVNICGDHPVYQCGTS